jgi:uncharacterized protein YhaN
MARERRRKELEHRIQQAEAQHRAIEHEVNELREDLALERELWRAESSDRSQRHEDVQRSRHGDRNDNATPDDPEDQA